MRQSLIAVTRRLHSATDVERVLPAGAESQARHPHDTAVAVMPIPYNGASATRAVMSPTCRNAVYNDGALSFMFPCWFRPGDFNPPIIFSIRL